MDVRAFASSSSGNCYYISDGSTPLLLDCGLAYREIQRLMNFRMSELIGVLVTHEHMDHAKAVKDVMKAGLDVFMSQGTADALEAASHRVKIIRAGEQFTLGTWTILPFDTVHDAAEPVGFLLASAVTGEKLLYLTDTAYCKYRFSGLTHILAEANYSTDILNGNVAAGAVPVELRNRLLHSHMSLETLKDMLRANDLSRVQRIWLIHLSNGNSDADRFKREIAALTGKLVTVAG